MQEDTKGYFVNIYLTAVLMGYLILNQGGYFAGGIISTGILVSLMLCFTKLRCRMPDIGFFLFALWYLFCSVRTGFDIRYLAKGLLPFLCLMFRFTLPPNREKAAELCRMVITLGFAITVIAVFTCVSRSFHAGHLLRLTFPFQYANASGIFFGVLFILTRHGKDTKRSYLQYGFFLGLILTQSVGAIGITVLAELLLSRNWKQTLFLLAVLAVGAVLLKGRIYQSIGTFTERFLQMRDGFSCMLQNPVFGIGAGRWETHKELYQSGFYDAKEIHGSIAQIAAASGIPGILLFGIALFSAFRSIKLQRSIYPIGALMILAHSLLDFTLTFTALDFLVILLLACCEPAETKQIAVKPGISRSICALCTVVFLILGTGMYQIKKLDGIYLGKNYTNYIRYYDSHPLSRRSRKTVENYAKSLYAVKRKEDCLTVLENMNALTTDMIVLKKGCTNNWKEAMDCLETQPYNESLYKALYYNSNDETLRPKIEELFADSVDSMSFLGKLLYQFKGEEKV